MVDISVILTAHREGVLTGATANSARAAMEFASKQADISIETIVVLDKTDEVTRQIMNHALGDIARIIETDEGDPGQSRNRGIELAQGQFSTFLDGDDLWSYNWLYEAWKKARAHSSTVFHSHCNIVFGKERNIWWHIDSDGIFFDENYLRWANYWDAMSFAETRIYREFPFKKNDLKLGFGHEDWHWNAWTTAEGIGHKPVENTIHFKRRRKGSQMALVEQSGSTVWPLELG